jgi:hypothetical protein
MEENELVVVPKVELAEKDELIKSAEERCQKLKSDFTRYKKRVDEREEAVSGKVPIAEFIRCNSYCTITRR